MADDAPLTHPRIFRFYFPLALSWLFMSIEAPVSIGLISRLPNPIVHTAAFLMLMGLSLWIESPVIDLLSTSTTLCKSRGTYRVLRRFVWWTMAWCTVVHALVTLTPLYGLVTEGILHLPEEVVSVLRTPLTIMIPWSALIGWRRFRQGILIRSGLTRAVGMGTAVRLTTMVLVGGACFASGRFTGTQATAIALIASVLSEAVFAHFASAGAVGRFADDVGDDLTTRAIAKFHLPLTATTMLTLSTGPVIGAALAHSTDAVLSMAAWQVTTTLVWMHRTIVFALPEAVITLYKGRSTVDVLRQFCFRVGMFSTVLLSVLWLARGDVFLFTQALGTLPATAETAHQAVGLCVLFPLVGALQSFAKGTLAVHRQTMPRLMAMGAGMFALLVGLAGGVALNMPGVVFAASAMTIALLAELAVLAHANRKALDTDTRV